MNYTYDKCLNRAKKYNYLKDFSSSKAYKIACENGWDKDYTWLIEKKPKKVKWTYEICYEEAKKYEYKCDFYSYSYHAYIASISHKWYKDYTWLKNKEFHPVPASKRYNLPKKWDIRENCIEESKKYSSRKEFNNGNKYAYEMTNKNGWMDTLDWLSPPYSSKIKWTYEKCLEEAKKHSTRSDFQKSNPSVYIKCLNNGWINNFYWMKAGPSIHKKWVYDTCLEEAKKYSTKKDFIEQSWTCYCVCSRNKWLKDFNWLKKAV